MLACVKREIAHGEKEEGARAARNLETQGDH